MNYVLKKIFMIILDVKGDTKYIKLFEINIIICHTEIFNDLICSHFCQVKLVNK